MFHGTRDFNVRIAQARELQRALEAAGRPSRLTVFDELEHGLADSAARARMLDEIAAFLAASLGD
jgi:dipeptidyl aminopeptidase/acylaminoacyl peptidase